MVEYNADYPKLPAVHRTGSKCGLERKSKKLGAKIDRKQLTGRAPELKATFIEALQARSRAALNNMIPGWISQLTPREICYLTAQILFANGDLKHAASIASMLLPYTEHRAEFRAEMDLKRAAANNALETISDSELAAMIARGKALVDTGTTH